MSHINCLKRLKKVILTFVLIPSLLVLLFAYLLSDATYAQTSENISLQGKIVRNDAGYEGLNVVNGTPSCVASGPDTCDFQVKYYSASTAGTLYLTEKFTDVEIGDYGGVFNLRLGSGVFTAGTHATLDAMLSNESTVYMQIEFAPTGDGTTFSEVFTRTPLNASAYSIRSKYAEGSVDEAFKFYNASSVSSVVEGSVYYDTDDNELKLYNGTSWVSVGNAGASAWSTSDVGTNYSAYMSDTGIGAFSNFTLDLDDDRMSINTDVARGGLSIFSSYNTAGSWPLVSFKSNHSNFSASILELTQFGTGDIITGNTGSTLSFQVDHLGDLHLANNGIAYFEPFASLPGVASLNPNTGEGCMYSYGGDIYWDPICDGSGSALSTGGATLWTDGGTFTYLTSTTDDLILGASTTTNPPFFFDVSEKRIGIGTSTPQSTIDIAGASSVISNNSGNITINPADRLAILGDVELGDGSTTRSLYSYNALRTYYGQIELYNLATGNLSLTTTFDTGNIVLNAGADVIVTGGGLNMSQNWSNIYGENLKIWGNNNSDIYLQSDAGSGNIGIGTTTPSSKLEIAGVTAIYPNTTGANAIALKLGQVSDGTASSVDLYVGDVAGASTLDFNAVRWGANFLFSRDSSDGNQNIFEIVGSDTTHTLNLYDSTTTGVNVQIKSDGDSYFNGGNVGIGTVNPTANLSVLGSITGGSNAVSSASNNFTFGYKGHINNLKLKGFPNSGSVYKMASHSDGRIIAGGFFYRFDSRRLNSIVGLNQDGTYDTAFDVGEGFDTSYWSGYINDIAIQDDGKVLVSGGGLFSYNGTPVVRIARLNTDGSLDTTFNVGTGPSSDVSAVAIQADGKILIGGSISTYNGTSVGNIARLNSDGSLDATFGGGTRASNSVSSIEVLGDGKILIAGYFTSYGGVTRQRIARLNSDGTLDTTFDSSSGADGSIRSIFVQSDGKILIGGDFTSYAGVTRQRIARLNSDGSLDTTFDSSSGAGSTVRSIAIQNDGKILIGGNFTTYDGVTKGRMARLHIDGSLDTSFKSSSFDYWVSDFLIESEDSILISGGFTMYGDNNVPNFIIRVNSKGRILSTFGDTAEGFSDSIRKVVMSSDDKYYVSVGGDNHYGKDRIDSLVRLNSNLTLDKTFSSASFETGWGSGSLYDLKTQNDGKIVVGGYFTLADGLTRQYVARLNSDGSLDTGFDSSNGAGSSVSALAIQNDDKILIGGYFTTYGGVTRERVARLNSDGSLDTTFVSSSGANNTVNEVSIQVDGKILIAGSFESYGGVTRQRIARLNSDGSLDTTFDSSSGANGTIYSMKLLDNGKILIGGYFTTYGGVTRHKIARLNSDGSLDTTFDSSSGANGNVMTITVRSDGKILISGEFSSYGGVARSNLALLEQDGSLNSGLVPKDNVLMDDYNPFTSVIERNDGNILVGGPFFDYDNAGIGHMALLDSSGALVKDDILTNSDEDSFLLGFSYSSLTINSSGSFFSGLLSLSEPGSDESGGIRYNSGAGGLELSSDGSTWLGVADAIKTTTLSAEYPGAVLAADGTNNTGFMTSDAEGSASNSMNYYEWNSSETTLQDYDVRLRFTLPHDFASWGSNAFTLHFATQANTSTNNKVDIYVYEESSSTVDGSSVDQYSSTAGVWETTSIQGADIGDCDTAGQTCLILIRMYSANDNYIRIGDIDINYNRKL